MVRGTSILILGVWSTGTGSTVREQVKTVLRCTSRDLSGSGGAARFLVHESKIAPIFYRYFWNLFSGSIFLGSDVNFRSMFSPE